MLSKYPADMVAPALSPGVIWYAGLIGCDTTSHRTGIRRKKFVYVIRPEQIDATECPSLTLWKPQAAVLPDRLFLPAGLSASEFCRWGRHTSMARVCILKPYAVSAPQVDMTACISKSRQA